MTVLSCGGMNTHARRLGENSVPPNQLPNPEQQIVSALTGVHSNAPWGRANTMRILEA